MDNLQIVRTDPGGTHIVTPKFNIGDRVKYGNTYGIVEKVVKDIFNKNFWYYIGPEVVCETELELMPDVL